MRGVHLSILALLLIVPSGLALECYTCYSTKSWDECLKTQIKLNCEALVRERGRKNDDGEQLSVCTKVSLRKRRHNGQEINEYSKSCFDPDQCSVEKCRQGGKDLYDGTWCEIECCQKSNCNTGTTKYFNSRAEKNLVSATAMGFCVLGFLLSPGLR